jgi:hypothetical protein
MPHAPVIQFSLTADTAMPAPCLAITQ